MLMPLFLFCSCRTVNPYENNYYQLAEVNEYTRALPGTMPDMQEIVDWETMRALQEEGGYMVIGISAFSRNWAPRLLALECARRNGAHLIRFYHKDATEKKQSRVTLDPVRHRGTTCGIPGGYSWMKVLHGIVPVTVHEQDVCYPQYAYYLAKRKHVSAFGVYFRLPDVRDPRIRVGVVVPGSPAAKQGIKPGDRVYSINGRIIHSGQDVIPYMENKAAILRMEVIHD